MSSDSSDDEDLNHLREAVDVQFINDGMFSHDHKKQHTATNGDTEKLPSLRPSFDNEDQFDTLGVTPQFQEYVAKQLSSTLEKKLQKKLTNDACTSMPQKRKKSGVKLFNDSNKYIKLQKRDHVIQKKPKTNDNESDNESKCSEVAVNPTDILDKTDVKNWSTRSKAPVFRYQKTSDGTLTLLD